jgi:hypothetical protein
MSHSHSAARPDFVRARRPTCAASITIRSRTPRHPQDRRSPPPSLNSKPPSGPVAEHSTAMPVRTMLTAANTTATGSEVSSLP